MPKFEDFSASLNLIDAEDLISSVLAQPRLIRKVENFHALKVILEELKRIRHEEFE
jgi:hypothetical protein